MTPAREGHERERDPVTVVFYGYAKASRALNHVQAHTGWSVRPTPRQSFETWGNCGKTYGELASGRFWEDRFHVRVRKASRRYGTWGTTALATPHHEDYIWWNPGFQSPQDKIKCIHAVDKGGVGPNGGGLYSGFMRGRDELVNRMTTSAHHRPVYMAYWQNTREFKQCDQDWAGSDGYVAWVKIPNSSH